MNQEMLEAFIFKAEERFATISLVERGIRNKRLIRCQRAQAR